MNSIAKETSATDKNTNEPAYITELKKELTELTYEEMLKVISFAEVLKKQRTQTPL